MQHTPSVLLSLIREAHHMQSCLVMKKTKKKQLWSRKTVLIHRLCRWLPPLTIFTTNSIKSCTQVICHCYLQPHQVTIKWTWIKYATSLATYQVLTSILLNLILSILWLFCTTCRMITCNHTISYTYNQNTNKYGYSKADDEVCEVHVEW